MNKKNIVIILLVCSLGFLVFKVLKNKFIKPTAIEASIISNKVENNFEYLQNRENILKSIKGEAFIFTRISEHFKNDREIVLAAVISNGYILYYVSTQYKDDKEVVLSAVKNNGIALKFASNRLKDDDEIVMTAIAKNTQALAFASSRFLKNRGFVLGVLKSAEKKDFLNDGSSFVQFLSGSFSSDKEIMSMIAKYNGAILEYADESIKNDKEIVLIAMSSNGEALRFVSDKLKDDLEVVSCAINNNPKALEYAAESIKDHKGIVMKVLEKDTRMLKFVSPRLKNDLEIVIPAVSKDGYVLSFTGMEVRDNTDVVRSAINENPSSLKFASDRLKDDYDIVLEAVKKSPNCLEYASERLKNDENIIKAVRESKGIQFVFKYLPPKWKNNKEIGMEAVSQYAGNFRYVSDSFKDDKEVVLAAVKANRGASILQFVSDRLKDDREIIYASVANDGESLKYAPPKYQEDSEVVLTALKNTKYAFQYASERLKNDKMFLLDAMKIDGGAIVFIPEKYQSDRELAVEAVKQNYENFRYLPKELQNDENFILEVSSYSIQVLNLIPDKIAGNSNFQEKIKDKFHIDVKKPEPSIYKDIKLIHILFYSPTVIKKDGTIVIQLKNGQEIAFTNLTPTDEYETDGACFDFEEYFKNIGYFLLSESFYEGGRYVMVNDSNGEKSYLDAHPIFSPNNKYIISAEDETYNWSGIKIWEITKDKLQLQFEQEDYGFKFDKWLGDDSFRIKRKSYSHIKHDADIVKRENGIWMMIEEK